MFLSAENVAFELADVNVRSDLQSTVHTEGDPLAAQGHAPTTSGGTPPGSDVHRETQLDVRASVALRKRPLNLAEPIAVIGLIRRSPLIPREAAARRFTVIRDAAQLIAGAGE